MAELLLGCGHDRKRRIRPPGTPEGWTDLITADINPAVSPDLIVDLDTLKWRHAFGTFEPFDEVHAYEVLEHVGQQGDVLGFFSTFYNIWSVLKPGGYLCATTPSRYSAWLWGDPGHRRVILPESLTFLCRPNYQQLGRTQMSDYRDSWHGDFDVVDTKDDKVTHRFCLTAIKPPRPYKV